MTTVARAVESDPARRAFDRPAGNWIDGRWEPPVGGRWLDVEDPSTTEVFSRIPASDRTDVAAAVTAARRAFEAGEWSAVTPSERGRAMWRLASLIREHAEALAWVEMRDSGKPIREAREDMAGVADIFEFYAGMASKIVGQTMPLPGGQLGTVLRSPVGVVGTITPWNFPLYVAAWKVAPALCCGNSVILKPSELASLTCLALGELASEAGIPDGAFNVVSGLGDPAGAALASHPDVDVLAFTGGTVTGRKVMAARAELIRPVQLELGGKSPNVVFADADLDAAAAGAAFGIFYTQGENCNAGSRILVEASVYDRFLEMVVDRARSLRVGAPSDPATDMGALISRAHLDKVAGYVEVGRAEGVRVATGGSRLTDSSLGGGYFYGATVLADVPADARVFQEEIFGPVVTVTPFRDDDDAIRLANATDYGLAAGVWTSNVDRALRCVQRIESGYVWVNTFNGTPIEAPFGGVKLSGFGRDCGSQAIDTYTSWKTVAWAVTPFADWYRRD
ncbi:MAG TPA: aldehyde dehydrogenase family protein [Candidatus Dormibacteraeota bacterium]|nr:aldehyde dehydrogenase family protein [Candidatus Dormibacteraeota bacterium]